MKISAREYWWTITATFLIGGIAGWGFFGPYQIAWRFGWTALEAIGSILAAAGAYYAARTAIGIAAHAATAEKERDHEARLRSAHAVLVPIAQELLIVHHRLKSMEDGCRNIPDSVREHMRLHAGVDLPDDPILFLTLRESIDRLHAPMCERFIDRLAGLDEKVGEATGRAITMFLLLKAGKQPEIEDVVPSLMSWLIETRRNEANNVRQLIWEALELIKPELKKRGLIMSDYDPSVVIPPPPPGS